MYSYDNIVKWKSQMSPRPKHIPVGARPTTIKLTDEDKAAINWISLARSKRGDSRKTLNDILVDGLWCLLEQKEGRTRESIQATIPPTPKASPIQANVTEMPKPKKA